jgi:hypothetical protein
MTCCPVVDRAGLSEGRTGVRDGLLFFTMPLEVTEYRKGHGVSLLEDFVMLVFVEQDGEESIGVSDADAFNIFVVATDTEDAHFLFE